MNRLRKTTATLLIAIFMISIFVVAIPVIAQDMEKPEARASAIGQFTSMWSSTLGDRCLVSVHARRTASGWTGKGVFRDKDYELTATLTVDSADEYVGDFSGYWCNQVILHGDAEVYINDVYVGVRRFDLIISDANSLTWYEDDYVSFDILLMPYFARVLGTDISVKTTVDVPLD